MNLKKFLQSKIAKIEKVYGESPHKDLEFSTKLGAWVTNRNVIVLGTDVTANKFLALLAVIHELGHLYTKSRKELKANIWALECISKVFPKSRSLKYLYFSYLLKCLNSGENPHSAEAHKLLDHLKVKIVKIWFEDEGAILDIELPKAYKSWYNTKKPPKIFN